jgi:hypothetical protein
MENTYYKGIKACMFLSIHDSFPQVLLGMLFGTTNCFFTKALKLGNEIYPGLEYVYFLQKALQRAG